jgi:hypothetical protein
MKVLTKLTRKYQMNWFKNLQVIVVSLTGISGMELLQFIRSLQPDLMFAGQTVISVLTIIYLIKKIRRK